MRNLFSLIIFLILSLSSYANNDSTVFINRNHFTYNVLSDIKNLKTDSIIYENLAIEKNRKINIDAAYFHKLRFQNNSFGTLSYFFTNDSLRGEFIFADTKGLKQSNNYLLIDIEDTYLNNNFMITPVSEKQTVIFNNCVFGDDVRRVQIKADTVRFMNCDFPYNNITLEILPANHKVYFELYRTDISNIRFTFPENMELFFIRDTAYEIQKTVFEKLLSKFKAEGKDVSYKNLDVQYICWKASHRSWVTKAVTYINQIWWNFGYSKQRVFGWTLFFLFIFSLFNLRKWDAIHQTYPVNAIAAGFIPKAASFKNKFKNVLLVILYTCLVFFSLKIDLKNLNTVKLRYTIAFFIEYMIGLTCLIFITGAILKF